jgi:hypothetical protein
MPPFLTHALPELLPSFMYALWKCSCNAAFNAHSHRSAAAIGPSNMQATRPASCSAAFKHASIKACQLQCGLQTCKHQGLPAAVRPSNMQASRHASCNAAFLHPSMLGCSCNAALDHSCIKGGLLPPNVLTWPGAPPAAAALASPRLIIFSAAP